MLAGVTRPGPTAFTIPADRVFLIPVTLTESRVFSKLTARLDGLGASIGAQTFRGVVYDDSGALLGAGADVVVVEAAEIAWVDLRIADLEGTTLMPGDYRIGFHSAGVTDSARTFVTDPGTPEGQRATDAFLDGPAAELPATTALTHNLAVFATLLEPWVTPDETEEYLSSMPMPLSQRVFGVGGPLNDLPTLAICGWHGAATDPGEQAVALVRTGSELEDLVGERLRVTYRRGTVRRSVIVYCKGEDSFEGVEEEDVSITRRAFLELELLPLSPLRVRVEVMS